MCQPFPILLKCSFPPKRHEASRISLIQRVAVKIFQRVFDPLLIHFASFSTSVAWPVMLKFESKICRELPGGSVAKSLDVHPENLQKIVAVSLSMKL